MNKSPLLMEKYFQPGFKTKPGVFEGSQTFASILNNTEEQAWEGIHLAGTAKGDTAIVRNIDPQYIQYWQELMDNPTIFNFTHTDSGNFLTQALLDDDNLLSEIRDKIDPDSVLMVFLPTQIEQELANKLNIPLHGSPKISELYGTKTGIRNLAKLTGINMAPGFICTSQKQVQDAISQLKSEFTELVIKHDHSFSGYFSKKINSRNVTDVTSHLNQIAGKKFVDHKERLVVEGWLQNSASLCAHIEILKDQDPIICAAWQQKIAADGISYMGGGPLNLSDKAFKSFMVQVNKLATSLKQVGAIGSYGPDFLITSPEEKAFEPETCVLIELNARVPYTAFPLEIIKNVKGDIGNGFFASHIKLKKSTKFYEVYEALEREKLLVRKPHKNDRGVIPYNSGLLPWGIFDIVAMAGSWEEVVPIMQKVYKLFEQDLTLI